jgi:sugar phosphate isomerase/epimerase
MQQMTPSKMIVVGLLTVVSTVHAEQPFFALDNAFSNGESVQEQASILKELGYDGICTRPNAASPELYTAFDKLGLDISATYVVLSAEIADLPSNVVKHLESLKGRDTIVCLALTNVKASEVKSVAAIRMVCDHARANGLEVVLYPHAHFRTDTIQRCERLRKLAKRPGLGISFNLCHFLYQNEDERLEETLKSIAPNLKLVQLNGANRIPREKPQMSELILPLGEGTFDVGRVLRTLDEIGYEGPVSLQCYNIAQPATEHLKSSMNAWRKYRAAW